MNGKSMAHLDRDVKPPLVPLSKDPGCLADIFEWVRSDMNSHLEQCFS